MGRRAAFVIASDPYGRVLVLRRTRTHPRYPLHWTLPGGGVEKGETTRKAAQSELREETGIRVPKRALRFIKTARVRGAVVDYFAIRFSRVPATRGDDEHDRRAWVAARRLGSARPADHVLKTAVPLVRQVVGGSR